MSLNQSTGPIEPHSSACEAAPSSANFHLQCQELPGSFRPVEHEVGQDIRGLARLKMSLYMILSGETLLSGSTGQNMKPDDHDSEQARAGVFSLSIKYRETPRHHEKVKRD